jgi:hypothetical protein
MVQTLSGWSRCEGGTCSGPLHGKYNEEPYPNLQGLFVRCVEKGTAVNDPDRDNTRFLVDGSGNMTRSAHVRSLQYSALQAHTHNLAVVKLATDIYKPGQFFGDYGRNSVISGWDEPSDDNCAPYPPTEGGGPETRPENVALYFIIANGLEPSRAD